MGMLHLRPDEVTLEELVATASAIALVHPATPAQRVEEVTVEGGGPGPAPTTVRWARVWERVVVDEWLRPPGPGAPSLIEVDGRGNEASAREADDAANGLLGHVHHVVFEPHWIGIPGEWRGVASDGPRIVFLSPLDRGAECVRFAECRHGLALPVAARERVRALLPPPAPPRRRSGVALVVAAAALAAGALLALWARR